MSRFLVRKAKDEDVYQDMARIYEDFRVTATGEKIAEGTVMRIRRNDCCVWLVARGMEQFSDGRPEIFIDERTRHRLGVRPGETVDLELLPRRSSLDDFRWAWGATDPAYRISARLALLSVSLGAIGLGLGILSLCKG